MPQKPTNAEIEKARKFILSRISNQRELEERLEYEFQSAAEKIAAIVMKYKRRGMTLHFVGSSKMAREIQDVIDELEDLIDMQVAFHCIPDEVEKEEEEEQIVERVLAEDHGATFKEREEIYLNAYLAALAKFDEWDAIDDEDEIIEAINDSTSKAKSRLSLLSLNSVAVGFAAYLAIKAESNHAIGFFVLPGSNNPCDYCSDQFNFLHKMDDPAPPYHPHCCCLTVYVNG